MYVLEPLCLQNTTLLTGNAWAYKMFDASAFLPPSGMLEVQGACVCSSDC